MVDKLTQNHVIIHRTPWLAELVITRANQIKSTNKHKYRCKKKCNQVIMEILLHSRSCYYYYDYDYHYYYSLLLINRLLCFLRDRILECCWSPPKKSSNPLTTSTSVIFNQHNHLKKNYLFTGTRHPNPSEFGRISAILRTAYVQL